MNRQHIYLIAFLLVALFSDCRQNCLKSDQQIIQQTEIRFPQLKTGNQNQNSGYTFFKSITLANPAVQIKLFKPSEMYNNNYQGIIIISNSKGISCAIPLLDNKYKGYWGFLFDTKSKEAPLIPTTFEKEINNALSVLQLNKGDDGSTIIAELFNSILDCKQLSDDDLAGMKKYSTIFGETGLPNDNNDSCNKRDGLNIESISKLMHPRKYEIDENAFFDSRNNRIYQLNFNRFPKATKKYYKIIVYRLGCVIHPIYL